MSFNAPEATKRIYKSVRPTEIMLTQAQNMWCSFSLVTPRHADCARRPKCSAGEAIQFSADQMAQRVARQAIGGQQNDVHEHNQRAHADAEAVGKIESAPRVVPKEGKNHSHDVEEIAVNILKNERESRLTTVLSATPFADGASGRIKKRGPVIRLAIVIARNTKSPRPAEN